MKDHHKFNQAVMTKKLQFQMWYLLWNRLTQTQAPDVGQENAFSFIPIDEQNQNIFAFMK